MTCQMKPGSELIQILQAHTRGHFDKCTAIVKYLNIGIIYVFGIVCFREIIWVSEYAKFTLDF